MPLTLRKRRLLPPMLVRWGDGANPLPVRLIRSKQAGLSGRFQEPPAWLVTGAADMPFDFTGHMHRLLADIVARCEPLRHIDVSRVLVAVVRARNSRSHGLQARLTPLRPAGLGRAPGAACRVQRYFLGRHEFYYIMTFFLPRFLNQDFSEKLVTLFHELYHIGPRCQGDLRVSEGSRRLHSPNRQQYDREMAALAREYLSGQPDPSLHVFLRLDFAQLQHRHGAVAGIVVPHPRRIEYSARPARKSTCRRS